MIDLFPGLKAAIGDAAVDKFIAPALNTYIAAFAAKEWADPATAAQKAAEMEEGLAAALEGGVRMWANDPSKAPPA